MCQMRLFEHYICIRTHTCPIGKLVTDWYITLCVFDLASYCELNWRFGANNSQLRRECDSHGGLKLRKQMKKNVRTMANRSPPYCQRNEIFRRVLFTQRISLIHKYFLFWNWNRTFRSLYILCLLLHFVNFEEVIWYAIDLIIFSVMLVCFHLLTFIPNKKYFLLTKYISLFLLLNFCADGTRARVTI